MPPPSVSSPSSRLRRTCFIDTNPLLPLFCFFLTILSGVNLAAAETTSISPTTTSTPQGTPTIAAGTDGYKYVGCFIETTTVSGTGSGTRALYGGINEVLPGEMTVEKCLSFCKGGMEGRGYRFAGLEYSRECWCASQIASLSAHVIDHDCNLACDGNKSQICGGDLRISVYDLNGGFDSVAAAGRETRFALGLALAVGGVVVAGLLW